MRFTGLESLGAADITIIPQKSMVKPGQVKVHSRLTQNIILPVPIVAAAMEFFRHKLAIALAREGGTGVFDINLSLENLIEEIKKTKRAQSLLILNPYKVNVKQTLADVNTLMINHNISGVVVVDDDDSLAGIFTKRDGEKHFKKGLDQKVKDVMVKELITVPLKTPPEEAYKIMLDNLIEKLPVYELVGDKKILAGLITKKDIENAKKYKNACIDKYGRLVVGAALSIVDFGESMERAQSAIEAGIDFLLIDNSFGQSDQFLRFTEKTIERFSSQTDIIAGNVVTFEGGYDLAKRKVSAVRVGMAVGSICTTNEVLGTGRGMITSIMQVVEGVKKAAEEDKEEPIPISGDGGVRGPSDFIKYLGIGASTVTMGNVLARAEESAGQTFNQDNRVYIYYTGMGSIPAMKRGGRNRYAADSNDDELVAQGVESRIPVEGPVKKIIHRYIDSLQKTMAQSNSETIPQFWDNVLAERVTFSTMKDFSPHDIEAINIVQDSK